MVAAPILQLDQVSKIVVDQNYRYSPDLGLHNKKVHKGNGG